MHRLIVSIVLYLTLTVFTLSYAEELTKGIRYLGMKNGVKIYEILCSNGNKGEVYVDKNTKEIKIIKENGDIQNLGQIRFGEAVKKLCK